jgi:hypothetical protein
MKKHALTLATIGVAAAAFAESILAPINDLGYGTVSGRIQSLSMYRDYDNGNNNYATSLGIKLDYLSPERSGLSVGLSYIGVDVLDSMYDEPNPGDRLLGNGRVNVLNEAYLNYKMGDLGLAETAVTAGRRVYVGEVFRADDFRQKPRALEGVSIESRDIPDTRIQVGHAWEMSNWIDSGDQWDFENFDNYGTDGVTWGEVSSTRVQNLEVAVFDAIMYDIANLVGLRGKLKVAEKTALLGYCRWESDVGDGTDRDSKVLGLSVEQKVSGVTLEGGYFGVYGDNLVFQETTTGINHALGSLMLIYSLPFSGDTDTFYVKATTKIEQTKTSLYALYNYTLIDQSKDNLRQAQELNLVVSQRVPKTENLSVALKFGVGTRDGVDGVSDTLATDTRLFVTYAF